MGKPVESPLGDITDKWFANRTIGFAKICGYTGDKNSLSSAIKFLERKFKIPYDQSVGGGIFRELIDLTPSNHHFKSLGHNPTYHIPESTALWFQVFQLVYLPNLSVLHWHQ